MIYLFTFALSLLAAFFAANSKSEIRYVWALLAVLLPAILAGVRDESVGTDTSAYMGVIFEKAQEEGMAMQRSSAFGVEWGFIFTALLIVNFFGDLHWYYFFTAFLTCGFAFAALFKERRRYPLCVCYAFYLLVFFPMAFSMIRQSLAMSIVFFASFYALDKKWKSFTALVLIAFFFHTSAIFALVIPFVSKFVKKAGLSRILLFLAIAFIAILFAPKILPLLKGTIFNKYANYVGRETNFSLFFLVPTFYFFLLFNFYARIKKFFPISLITACVGFSFILNILGALVFDQASRLSLYFQMFMIHASAIFVLWSSKYRANNRLVASAFIIGFAVVHFLLSIVVMKHHYIYPYTSEILESIL